MKMFSKQRKGNAKLTHNLIMKKCNPFQIYFNENNIDINLSEIAKILLHRFDNLEDSIKNANDKKRRLALYKNLEDTLDLFQFGDFPSYYRAVKNALDLHVEPFKTFSSFYKFNEELHGIEGRIKIVYHIANDEFEINCYIDSEDSETNNDIQSFVGGFE